MTRDDLTAISLSTPKLLGGEERKLPDEGGRTHRARRRSTPPGRASTRRSARGCRGITRGCDRGRARRTARIERPGLAAGGIARSCAHALIRRTPEQAAQAAASQYRAAGSSLAPAVLSAVQAQIAGEPLDRAAEIAARGRGWRMNP